MKWFDQPEETVLAPMAYSSVKSQPMIQANKLAERRVGVGVSAARQRNHRGEFRVAQDPRRRTRYPRRRRKHEAGTGVVRAQARQHENASADDRANAERGKRNGAERALQGVLAAFPRLRSAANPSASSRKADFGTARFSRLHTLVRSFR